MAPSDPPRRRYRCRYCSATLPAWPPGHRQPNQGGVHDPAEIQALGVTQEGSPTCWRATGYVEGLGWLEAWGTSLIVAIETLQALAAQRMTETCKGEED